MITATVSRNSLRPTGCYVEVKELPVVSVKPGGFDGGRMVPEHINVIAGVLGADMLRHWTDRGCVVMSRREEVIQVACECYLGCTPDIAGQILDSWVREGVFREEDGWLIPEEKMLVCGSPEPVAPGQFWGIIRGHSGAKITIV